MKPILLKTFTTPVGDQHASHITLLKMKQNVRMYLKDLHPNIKLKLSFEFIRTYSYDADVTGHPRTIKITNW